MRRLPPVATAVVAVAVAAMIALGVWQIGRGREKDVQVARYAAAAGRPPIAFPRAGEGEGALFRRSALMCLDVAGWQLAPGRNRAGASGWRYLARCRTGAEGPGALVDIGWSARFDARPAWTGGLVRGTIAPAPDHRSLIATLTQGRRPTEIALIADTPAPGLAASAPPSVADIPNNHRGYAVQWFAFAAIAAIVYVVALRARRRG
ncbi:MAG: SURF1 family protein [Sphingomonas fennica]